MIQGVLLKKLVEALKELVQHVNISCDHTGITIQSMDNSHVSLVGVSLRSEGFETYRVDRAMVLGINLGSMAKILKCAPNDAVITLSTNSEETLEFTFEQPKSDTVAMYQLKLMDIEDAPMDVPEIAHDARIDMPSVDFQKICRDMGSMGDNLIIRCSKEGVRFSTTGELVGAANINIKPSAPDVEIPTVVHVSEPVDMTFALRYLGLFTKATPLSPTVSLCIKREHPLIVEYRLQDVGRVRFYLAPRYD